jgi:uncharacterized membrane protein YfcA
MSIASALALLGAGLVAGFVNTVAGGGSVVTIPVLVELFDASIANGTNRIAILMQNIVGVARYHGGGAVPWKRVLPLVPAVLVGAVAGAWVATRIDADAMQRVFAFVIVLVAASVLIKPSRWEGGTEPRLHEPWRSIVFAAIGFYGGFVQAGVGFLILGGLVIGGGLGLIKGNAGKVLLILLYTPVALLLFAGADQVNLQAGLVLGVGNMTGAFLASTLALKRGAGWIRWVLVIAAVAAALRMLLS